MIKRKLAAMLAMFALATPQIAAAQDCIPQNDMVDAVVYVMPSAYSAFVGKCRQQFSKSGFAIREGSTFISQYDRLNASTWNGAYRFLKRSSAADDELRSVLAALDRMPSSVAKPFVDAAIKAKLSTEIKVSDCGKIERAMESLAPLAPQKAGTLVAAIVDLVPQNGDLKLCPFVAK